MRDAMFRAEVGDDVLGDDPTVIQLEALAAEIMGKEAGLFVTSGTLGNNIAINVHTRPGDEVLMDWDSHSMCYEVGAPAVISGIQSRQYRSTLGIPDLQQITRAITVESLHSPATSLIIVENTHNKHGGAVIPVDVIHQVGSIARERQVRFHIDGARIFNASIASGIPTSEIVSSADSVTFCLSKGLGCPVGSVLCGTREFVDRARRVRKMLGSGMRQVGILAAAGIYALKNNISRLSDDHANARLLAERMSVIDGIEVDLKSVQTNMVYFNVPGKAKDVESALSEQGILCLALSSDTIRMVTHLDVDREGVIKATEAMKYCLDVK